MLGLALQATQELNSRQLSVGLAAAVLLIAVWTVLSDVHRHVGREQRRQREAIAAGRQKGACEAADAIQNRIANTLSLTVGYAELLADDARLPADTREQGRKVIESAMTTVGIVSQFKQTLRCAADGRWQ
jgi:hypothetical protein